MRTALTIAGSDSGGGAGIQADLKTFQAFGVFGTSAITAITAQNTTGVSAVHVVPAAMVRAQIHDVVADLAPAACKTGMLATREIIETVATALREESLERRVIDPVMVATSGDRLLDAGSERVLIEQLIPGCTVVTPNLDEATVLTGIDTRDVDTMLMAAHRLVEMGAGAALVKGGHLDRDIVDVLYDGAHVYLWRQSRLQSRAMHGTGCTLSAALAACLALDIALTEAVARSIAWVRHGIAAAPRIGSGAGPLDHRGNPFTLPLVEPETH